MAAAPPDPYQGVAGLHAAWDRFHAWLTGDLPRQWDEIAFLLGQLGGTTTQPPIVSPPPLSPPPPLNPAEVYTLANLLTADDRQRAQAFIGEWPQRWAAGYRGELVPLWALDGSINFWSVAVQQTGWEVVISGDHAFTYPAGEGLADYPGAILWHPGDAYRSGSFIAGGALVSEFLRAPAWLQAVIRLAWPAGTWEKAAGIARAESGYNPSQHNTSGEDSRGIWQINVAPNANPDMLALGDLYDPLVNAQAAVQIWRRQGWQAWYNSCLGLGYPLTGGGVL